MALAYFSGRSTPLGKPFRFTAQDLEGRLVTESDAGLRGKVLVIDIWGTWCPACQQALPHLNELQRKYGGRGMEVVGVAFEPEPDRGRAVEGLRRFAEAFPLNYRMLYGGGMSEGELRQVFPDLKGFAGFPTTAVLDREGRLRAMTSGYSPDIARRIEAAVEESLQAGGG